jgi:hypothetical protein
VTTTSATLLLGMPGQTTHRQASLRLGPKLLLGNLGQARGALQIKGMITTETTQLGRSFPTSMLAETCTNVMPERPIQHPTQQDTW